MPPQRKAQMFIVTTVFLAATIFSIHGLLLAYSSIDLSGTHPGSDSYIIDNLEDAFRSALMSSDDCEEASDNVDELKGMISGMIRGGYELRASGDVNCTASGGWPGSGPELTMEIRIIREGSESSASLELYRA